MSANVDEKVPDSVIDPPVDADTGVKEAMEGLKPFAERETESGELAAFDENTRDVLLAPVSVGENVTVNVAESPGATDTLVGETEKTAESMDAEEIERVIEPAFETVTVED